MKTVNYVLQIYDDSQLTLTNLAVLGGRTAELPIYM